MANANAIELQLSLNDQLTAGLAQSSSALGGFVGQLESLANAAASAEGILGITVGAVAAIGAAGVAASLNLAESVKQLENLSAQSGVSAANLQVIQFAFRRAGIDSGSLSTGLFFLNRAIANNSPALAQLNITSRDTFTAFMQAAQGIAGMTDATERANVTRDLFGRGSRELIPVILDLAGSFDKMDAAATLSGNKLSGEQLDAMMKTFAASEQMKASIHGLGNEFALSFAPAVTSGANALTGLVENMRKAIEWRDKMDAAFYGSKARAATPAAGASPSSPGGIFGPDFPAELEAKRLQDQYDAIKLKRAVDFGGLPQFGSFADKQGLRGGSAASNFMNFLAPKADDVKLQLGDAGKAYAKFADDVAHSMGIVGQSVNQGFITVLTQLTSKTQTFASAMKTIWKSIVDGILSALADLIASAITGQFIKLLGLALTAITGNPGFGFGATSAAGGLTGEALVGGAPGAGAASLGGGGNTYVIQTFDAKSTLGALVNPTGSFRRANDRLYEIGAVS